MYPFSSSYNPSCVNGMFNTSGCDLSNTPYLLSLTGSNLMFPRSAVLTLNLTNFLSPPPAPPPPNPYTPSAPSQTTAIGIPSLNSANTLISGDTIHTIHVCFSYSPPLSLTATLNSAAISSLTLSSSASFSGRHLNVTSSAPNIWNIYLPIEPNTPSPTPSLTSSPTPSPSPISSPPCPGNDTWDEAPACSVANASVCFNNSLGQSLQCI